MSGAFFILLFTALSRIFGVIGSHVKKAHKKTGDLQATRHVLYLRSCLRLTRLTIRLPLLLAGFH